MLILLTFLTTLTLVSSAYLPSPYPSATPSPSLTPNTTPTALPAHSARPAGPTPTLAPRCDPNGGNCQYGGTAVALQADTVTSTILSVTSVPCYLTTTVIDEKTVVQTIYNTETVTETVTKEGKVFIIQYAPTPILKMTVVPKVIQVTVDMPSYWLESSGVAGYSTVKEEWSTKAADGGCPTCGKPQPQPQPVQGGPGAAPAWVYASASPGGSRSGSVPAAAGVGQAQGGDGWAVAAGGNGQQGGVGATWGDGGQPGQGQVQGQGRATWYSAASPRRSADAYLGFVCVGMALGVVVCGELLHFLR